MRVGLVASADFAVVRFVRRVDVGVLLPVRRVGEPPIAAVKLAFEGLLACGRRRRRRRRRKRRRKGGKGEIRYDDKCDNQRASRDVEIS